MEDERKGILQFIKNCIYIPNYNEVLSNDESVMAEMKELFSFLSKHYFLRDIEERRRKQSRHYSRFSLTYAEKNEMTFFEISDDMYIDIHKDTFKYHIRNYNQDILEYISEESNANPIYKLILKEYLNSDP